MKSQLNIIMECPYCHKPTGYYFTRDGLIYNQEIVGRYLENSIQCVHCKSPIELIIHFVYRKTKKK